MATNTSNVTVSLDPESKQLLKRVANALEEANRIELARQKYLSEETPIVPPYLLPSTPVTPEGESSPS